MSKRHDFHPSGILTSCIFQAVMSSEGVPQLALVNGLCTAGAAYTPTMADQAIMVKKISNIYLGGPPLVKAALGEVVSGKNNDCLTFRQK